MSGGVTRCMTLDLGGRDGKVMLAQDVCLVVVAVVEQRQALDQPIGKAIELNAALGRNGEGQDDAGKRSVHAALEHAEPQQQTQYRIRGKAVMLRLVEPHERAGHKRGGAQPKRIGALTVEDGDGGDGDEVVGDGERREEHAHAVGHADCPKSDSTPSAKAISVAMGMAQPLCAPAWLKIR